MTDEPAPGSVGAIAHAYAGYCVRVADAIAGQEAAIEALIDAMKSAGAIHCYGFGRTGDAAESLAIRLRHFQSALPPAWWVGDSVRDPFGPGQLLIAFSRQGRGAELRALVRHARACGLTLAFVTAALKKSESAARLSRRGDILVKLPQIDPALLSPADVYGGGDFELAAYLFQEALATRMGLRFGVPPGAVPRYHVFH